MMKICFFIAMMLSPVQKRVPLPHGMMFGKKVDERQNMSATKLEAYMGKRTRISTTIFGKVIQVDTPKGGWFRMDAGNGNVIKVHFTDYSVTIPKELKGRTVMIQGIAQKQFMADEMQHYTGDKVKGGKEHQVKVAPKRKLTFEASGLMVE
ncbi:MAG: DUF4920 domain-containing protein [Mucilaginibacter sp.]|uniref:DUF4920 domain-containing protein n=1 Tax=Mucilaginibacter sp. TaxID=1882438 RepID=UPI003263BCC1